MKDTTDKTRLDKTKTRQNTKTKLDKDKESKGKTKSDQDCADGAAYMMRQSANFSTSEHEGSAAWATRQDKEDKRTR